MDMASFSWDQCTNLFQVTSVSATESNQRVESCHLDEPFEEEALKSETRDAFKKMKKVFLFLKCRHPKARNETRVIFCSLSVLTSGGQGELGYNALRLSMLHTYNFKMHLVGFYKGRGR